MAWRRARARADIVVALWLPLLCFAVLAWNHRWMSDDGFINLRIVWHLLHGHGPVFNIGERVEAGTSPLWIALLAVVRIPLWWADPAWVAVLSGIALTLLGLALAILGARRWWASLHREAVVPVGAVVLVALPPLWDFASSGLETGLGFAWIGACWWATARRLDDELRGPDDPWWTPLLIGLGPLVRPDFAAFTIAFAVALAATSAPGRRATARALAIGLTLPLAYQVFRMGYYGLLVPNTAIAKEASHSYWDRGWAYLDVYVRSTLLHVTVGLLLAAFVLSLPRLDVSRRHMVVASAPFLAGMVHTLYVVRVGGDFMYARLLLPGTFAAVCPLAAMPRPTVVNRRWLLATFAVVGGCALVVAGFRRWSPGSNVVALAINDERVSWTIATGRAHAVSLGDFDDTTFLRAADHLPEDGAMVDVLLGTHVKAPRAVVYAGPIGSVGTQLMGTHVVDEWGLAEPVGAHLEAGPRIRAGHEKPFPWEWAVGRFGSPPFDDPDARAAHAALECGDLHELEEAVSDPLTPGRFLRNVVGATRRTRLRVPDDPQEAEDRFCAGR